MGGLLGHAVEGALPGALAGGLIAQAAGPGVDFTLDLLDEFLLDGLRKGWHPRMFLGDLKKLRSHDLRIVAPRSTLARDERTLVGADLSVCDGSSIPLLYYI